MSAICGLVEASCTCSEPPLHDAPHVCRCGGAWTFDEAGAFVPVTFPTLAGGLSLDEAGAFAWFGRTSGLLAGEARGDGGPEPTTMAEALEGVRVAWSDLVAEVRYAAQVAWRRWRG